MKLITISALAHWALLMNLVPGCTAMLCPDPVSSEPRSHSNKPPLRFLSDLKSKKIDLIVLMERTRAVGRWVFNLKSRKLVSHALRYYAKLGPCNVRLVVGTFAADVTWHINGMTEGVTKCDVWAKYWPKVRLTDTPGVWNVTNVKAAYEAALGVFRRHSEAGYKKYLWILTSGDYRIEMGDPLRPKEELIGMNVTMVSMETTPIKGLTGKIRPLVNSPAHHGGTWEDWDRLMNQVAVISEPADIELLKERGNCYCDLTFGFEICGKKVCNTCPCVSVSEDCVCKKGIDEFTLCPRKPMKRCEYQYGKTGRYCSQKEVECVKDACANNGTCHEMEGHYTCTCTGSFPPGYFCENIPPGTTTGPPVVVNLTSIIVPAVILLVAAVLAVGVTIFCRHKGCKWPVHKSSIGTYTNTQQLEQGSSMQTQTSTIGVGPGGTYHEIPSLPAGMPPRPRAVIRPSVEQRPSPMIGRRGPRTPIKPDKSYFRGNNKVNSMLRRIPFRLWSTPTSGEVTVHSQNVDSTGRSTEEVTVPIYENSGSTVSMKPWENYLINLTMTGGFQHFAVVRYDRMEYSSTSVQLFLPTESELKEIYKVLTKNLTAVVISIGKHNYRVTLNNGRMLESFQVGEAPVVVCIGRSKQFLTLGLMETHTSQACYTEVKWVRDTLSKQKK